MAKITWKPGTMLSPLPPVLVSCGTVEKPNVLTIAWTGIISSEPAMTYVSIRPSRHSHDIIKEAGEFVINLPNLPLLNATDYCGVKSGKTVNKFEDMNLTAGACSEVSAPQIVESPVSLECKVKSITNYGTHDMFLAEIVAVNVDDKYIDAEGKLCLEKAGLIAFSHGKYFTLGRELGSFGFSVNKKRLAQMEKMKSVEVTVKHSKILKEEEPEAEKKPRRSVSRPRADGMERRLSEKSRRPREDGDERPRRDFGDKPRRPREDGDERPRRDFGDKPRRPREDGDRPRRDFGDKPRRPREDGDRPRRDFGDKPRRPREDGDRPRRDFGDKPRRPREDGDRPRRDFGDRPRPSRDGGDRPKRDFDDRPRPPRDGGDRPKRDFGDRPRPPRDGGDRPRRPREGGGDRKPAPRRSFNK